MAEQQWPQDGSAQVAVTATSEGVVATVAEVGSFDAQNAYLAKGVLIIAGIEFVVSMVLIIVSAAQGGVEVSDASGAKPMNPVTSAIGSIVVTLLVCGCAYVGVFMSNKCMLCCYGVMQILWGLSNLGLGCFCFCVVGTMVGLIEAAVKDACDRCKAGKTRTGLTCSCDEEELKKIGGLRGAIQIAGILLMLLGCFAFMGAYFGCALQGKIQAETKIILSAPKGAPTHQKAVQG